jgi:hypothetical protein
MHEQLERKGGNGDPPVDVSKPTSRLLARVKEKDPKSSINAISSVEDCCIASYWMTIHDSERTSVAAVNECT